MFLVMGRIHSQTMQYGGYVQKSAAGPHPCMQRVVHCWELPATEPQDNLAYLAYLGYLILQLLRG